MAGSGDVSIFPPGRYGRRRAPRPHRRAVTALLAALVVIGGLAISLRLYLQYGRPDYTPRVVSFTPDGPDAVTVTLEVTKPGGGPAVCHLRALTYDVAEVGSADVTVPAGRSVTVTHRVATTQRPYAVRVSACRAAD